MNKNMIQFVDRVIKPMSSTEIELIGEDDLKVVLREIRYQSREFYDRKKKDWKPKRDLDAEKREDDRRKLMYGVMRPMTRSVYGEWVDLVAEPVYSREPLTRSIDFSTIGQDVFRQAAITLAKKQLADTGKIDLLLASHFSTSVMRPDGLKPWKKDPKRKPPG